MQPGTTEEVFELLDCAIFSAALEAALEYKLFHILARRPKEVPALSKELSLAPRRCLNLLELMRALGLLRRTDAGYQTSELGRTLVLDAFSPQTWAFLARETRKSHPVLVDLAVHMRRPGHRTGARPGGPDDVFGSRLHPGADSQRVRPDPLL